MSNNKNMIAHLPMDFMGKIHQIFHLLASFSRNSINTNMVGLGDTNLETKQITSAVKFLLKFISKLFNHIVDNSVPMHIPAFAKTLFIESPMVGPVSQSCTNNSTKQSANQISTAATEGGRCMSQVQRNPRRNFLTGA
jgi:hypothetical protein